MGVSSSSPTGPGPGLLQFEEGLSGDQRKDMAMVRKTVTLAVVMWIGLAGVPAHATSAGGGSWTTAVIAWLSQAFAGVSENQPDDNGTIHVN